MNKLFRSFVLLISLSVVAMPTYAGSLYLTGHDVLLHSGQNGYWRVILDFLRGKGTASEIPEASYDMAFLNTGSGFNFVSRGYTGTVTTYNPGTATPADWVDVFSKDVIVVPWAPDFNAAARIAFNGKSAELEAFFNAGGDLWMNSGTGATDYYTVLPASVLSSGAGISGSTGFIATAEGITIGIVSNMINGFATHNNFTTVAAALTVFEEKAGDAISIGVADAAITGGGITTTVGSVQPVPTLSTWAMLLLILTMGGVAFVGLRRRFSQA